MLEIVCTFVGQNSKHMKRIIEIYDDNGRHSEVVTVVEDDRSHVVKFDHGNTTLDMLDRARARIKELEDALLQHIRDWATIPDGVSGATVVKSRAILNKKP